MNDKEKVFIQQIEEILDEYSQFRDIYDSGSDYTKVNTIITRIITVIERVSGRDSDYFKRIMDLLKEKQWEHLKVKKLVGVLNALYGNLKAGYLKSFSELIHADIFSDYIEMAEYLLEEGYKDAAAVITGSTLEEHLRKLCVKNEIDIEIMSSGKLRPKKADAMNSDLAKQKVYSKLEQKSVTAWLDLRNKAAHGNYSEYNDNQVKQMIMGVRDFIVRNPA